MKLHNNIIKPILDCLNEVRVKVKYFTDNISKKIENFLKENNLFQRNTVSGNLTKNAKEVFVSEKRTPSSTPSIVKKEIEKMIDVDESRVTTGRNSTDLIEVNLGKIGKEETIEKIKDHLRVLSQKTDFSKPTVMCGWENYDGTKEEYDFNDSLELKGTLTALIIHLGIMGVTNYALSFFIEQSHKKS